MTTLKIHEHAVKKTHHIATGVEGKNVFGKIKYSIMYSYSGAHSF